MKVRSVRLSSVVLQGQVLQPERDSPETLLTIKRTIGEYNFSAQYQQNPIPVGGAMIKTEWLQSYEPGALPEFSYKLQSWDTANKSGDLNDYSVCTTWGIVGGRRYLLDVVRLKLDYPDLKKLIGTKYRQFNPSHVIIENRASGIQLLQDLKRDGMYHLKPYDPPPGTDKIMRLHAQTAEFEAGNVLLP